VFTSNQALITFLCTVKSKVLGLDLPVFVFALQGKAVTMSNDDVNGGSVLGAEFGFGTFAGQFSHFRESSDLKEAVIKEETKFKIQMQL
jgi:hypothetical protein